MANQIGYYYDSVVAMTNIRKNAVTKSIQNAATLEKDGHNFQWMTQEDFETRFWFEVGHSERLPFEKQVHRQCIFCKTCGNYTQLGSMEEQSHVSQNCWCFCDLPELESISDGSLEDS